jgi:tRNA (Thr-GGU) A37 N-methylase
VPAEFSFRPIGILHSPFTESPGTPIQGKFAPEAVGSAEVFEEFAEGLADLEGFSHLYLI